MDPSVPSAINDAHFALPYPRQRFIFARLNTRQRHCLKFHYFVHNSYVNQSLQITILPPLTFC